MRTWQKSKITKLLTVKELAELMNVHPQTIYQLIYDKKIPFIKKKGIGYRFRFEDIEVWINKDHYLPVEILFQDRN